MGFLENAHLPFNEQPREGSRVAYPEYRGVRLVVASEQIACELAQLWPFEVGEQRDPAKQCDQRVEFGCARRAGAEGVGRHFTPRAR